MNSALKGEIMLTSKSFEFLMCKCTSFEEIRFVTSSGAGNHVTVYNTFIQSNTSNVDSSKFHESYSYELHE